MLRPINPGDNDQMTVAENIHHYAQRLPDELQLGVLNFVEYLLFKAEQETLEEQERTTWSELSLASAMRDLEDEDSPIYTKDNKCH
jgi:hypothetical protein